MAPAGGGDSEVRAGNQEGHLHVVFLGEEMQEELGESRSCSLGACGGGFIKCHPLHADSNLPLHGPAVLPDSPVQCTWRPDRR